MKRVMRLAALGLLVPALALAVPLQIPYSGQLSESGTLVNGTRAMTFVIYDAASGGSALYTQNEPTVTVTNGVYHTTLNAPDTVWTGADRWLGVSVNGGAELTPRTKVGSVPYAVRAGVAETVNGLPTIPADPFPGSAILTAAQKLQLNQWVGNVFQTWTRCYRYVGDNWVANFHAPCDNRGPSITVMTLSTGKVIGGYTISAWGSPGPSYGTMYSFLFSLTAGRTYPLGFQGVQHATGNFFNKGPIFGWFNEGGGPNSDLETFYGSPSVARCNFPNVYSRNGVTGAPNAADQIEFCGAANPTEIPIVDLEVWIKD